MVSDLDLGWLGGFFDAEGTMRVRRTKLYPVFELSVVNTDSTLIEKCKEILAQISITYSESKRKRSERHKICWTLSTGSTKCILTFARNISFHAPHKWNNITEAVRWFSKPKKTRKPVQGSVRNTWTPEFRRGWLGGFFDGEGTCVFVKKCGEKLHATYWLNIPNTDPALIEFSKRIMDELGIKYWTCIIDPGGNRKLCTCIRICRKDSIRKFKSMMPIYSPSKLAKFAELEQHFNRSKYWQNSRWTPEVETEIKKLHSEGLSLRAIVKKLGWREGAHHKISEFLHSFPH
jgi:hypothetical protein